MSRASRVRLAQMEKLLDLLSADGVLLNGRIIFTGTNKQMFWKRIATELNAVEGGVHKTTWQWYKMWADWKAKTKRKGETILLNKKSCNEIEQSNTPPLTSLEIRLLKIINYPIELKEDALNSDFVTIYNRSGTGSDSSEHNVLEDEPDTSNNIQVEFFNVDYGNGDVLTKNKSTTDEDKTSNCSDRISSKFCDVDNILQDNKDDEESSEYEEKFTISDRALKKKKVSLEEYKVRTTLKIEKERVQQKSEELRLRALELKLKGEEMRLKEIEMTKINYLTSIEEEKLKCFREISASLKELTDRTRNGPLRFPNVL